MAISWGSWDNSGGNGIRVGIDVNVANVGHNSQSVKFSVKVYTENKYSYSDSQTLNYGGALDGSQGFSNSQGGSPTLRDTLSYVYQYGDNSYGSSPGDRTFTARLSGAYNGVTPSVSVTVAIPARPIAVPTGPRAVTASRDSDTKITVTWDRQNDASAPYTQQYVRRWDHVSNAFGGNVAVGASATSYAATVAGNRRYRFVVSALNGKGQSPNTYSNFVQTSPAVPTGAAVQKSGTASVIVRWVNGPSGGYEYTTQVERQENNGAWSVVASPKSGVTSASFTNLKAGAVHRFRIRHVSTVGGTLYSGYATTPTIQLQAPPEAVTGITTTVANAATVTLSWANHPSTEAPYEGITIQRWDSASNAWTTVANLPATATTFTDQTASAWGKFQYSVRATNAAGASPTALSDYTYTVAVPPLTTDVRYTAAGQITVTFDNRRMTHNDYYNRVQVYRWEDGQDPDEDDPVRVLTTDLPAGSTSYTYTGADPRATYSFVIFTQLTKSDLHSGGEWSDYVRGSAAPGKPGSVRIAEGALADFDRPITLAWTHVPSQDYSRQRRFQYQHRAQGATAWVTSSIIDSGDETYAAPWAAGLYGIGATVEFQVRTWGVDDNPSVWSDTGNVQGHTTPSVTLENPAPGETVPMSEVTVDWTFYQSQDSTQAEWRLSLNDVETGTLVEARNGVGDESLVVLDRPVEDGRFYQLTLEARDSAGVWSDPVVQTFEVSFLKPAEAVLTPDLDPLTGVVVLTLTPGESDGVTSLPATKVDIERQILDPATGEYGEWEPVILGVEPDATIIDTTAPVHGDGHYRTTTYSAAPSMLRTIPIGVGNFEDQWAYLSGGRDFMTVCRLWANISISETAGRTKAIHYFAGRPKPVMYTGESADKTMSISGLITDDASPPAEWLRLAHEPGPVLFRAPDNRRIYGALSDVNVEFIHKGLHSVSFSIQEVFQ